MIATYLHGIEGRTCHVHATVTPGLPRLTIRGLPDATARETAVRVRAAITNSDLPWPEGQIVVIVGDESERRHGSGFDLPIALAILSAAGEVTVAPGAYCAELSLGGALRPVRGALAMAEAAAEVTNRIVVADGMAREAAIANETRGITVYAAPRTLRDLAAAGTDLTEHVNMGQRELAAEQRAFESASRPDLVDFRGQPEARRALEIAAAGGHSLLLLGGPGAGKTMLARRLPSILPPLTWTEELEVLRVHSAAGLAQGGYLPERPFRAPHHSTSAAGLVGGGSGTPRPGDLSLAHRGVLFLDELPEFSRRTIEVLRQPIETGEVVLSRAWGSVTFPARAQIVAAMNPCPCGFAGDPARECRCTDAARARYLDRVQPLLRYFDLVVRVPPVDLASLHETEPGESSETVRERVQAARERLDERGERRPTVTETIAALAGESPVVAHHDEAHTLSSAVVIGGAA